MWRTRPESLGQTTVPIHCAQSNGLSSERMSAASSSQEYSRLSKVSDRTRLNRIWFVEHELKQ